MPCMVAGRIVLSSVSDEDSADKTKQPGKKSSCTRQKNKKK